LPTPYYVRLKSGEPFAFAGLYERDKLGSKPIDPFAIITTAPNALMAPIHNRIPVILSTDDEQAWINPDTSPEGALDIRGRPLSADAMEAVPGEHQGQ
jgi:putative SOS response-associated peptidase YedK